MNKVEEIIAATKLSELMNKKEEDKNCKTVLWGLAVSVRLRRLRRLLTRYIVSLHQITWKTSKKILRTILTMISSMKMIRYKGCVVEYAVEEAG